MTTLAPRPIRSTTARPTTAPTTAAPTTPRGAAERSHASDYTELARRIKAAGLLGRRPGYYAIRGTILAALFAGAFVAFALIGQSWWQLAVAVGFGLLFAQAGFLAHDGAHRQMFESGKKNEWVSRVVANLVVGLGYGWWMHKHSKHHANPNTIGKDLDMDANAVVYTPQDAATRTGVTAFFMRKQGWFFLPAMSLTGLDLHVKTIGMLLSRQPVKHRWAELALITTRLVGFPLLAILVAGPVIGIAFVLVETLVFGFLLGASFAPNHIGMPLIDETQKVDYLRRQVLTSRNISGGVPMAIWMGGLNFQVEHHLFPNMPSANLKLARPIVRDYCLELGVHYTEVRLLASFRSVVQYIHRVGIKHRDPFDCPAAAQFRMIAA